MKLKRYARIATGTALALCLAGQVQAGGSGAMDDDLLNQLKRMIEQQQAQLDKQAAEIAALKERLGADEEALKGKADKSAMAAVDKMVVSRKANVDVELYGQINRAGLWAENGDSSRLYFVDNSNSSSRVGINAKADINDVLFGGKIEFELKSNSSSQVNITDEDPNNEVAIRHVDGWVATDKLGKLYFGRGDSASNGTSEVDLSGTSVVTYSAVADMAGGQLFYDSATNTLTDVSIGDVFTNMDGLSRRDRFRYDTPTFAGFKLSAGANEDDAYDIAARYSRKYEGIKVAAALAWAKSGKIASWDNQYNGSISVLHDSGFNLTFGAGTRDFDESGRDEPVFYYGKLGYIAQIWNVGSSNFSIEYSRANDVAQNEDEASAFGLSYVQNLTDWGTELYLAYRWHELDRTGSDFDDINAIMGGARIKF